MIERYTRPEMGRLWSEVSRYEAWLAVELAVCEAWAELGVIPAEAVETIRARARVDVVRIRAIETEVHHDVIAFTTSLAEQVGEAARYIHFGLTSSDVVDTAQSLLLRRAADILLEGLRDLAGVLADLARRHRQTVMIGRTHGVHAEPTTFGLKLALWYDETRRNIARLERARETVSVGKVSGSVGTYANVDPRVEAIVCRRLGLRPALISTQVLQRDRHAEFAATLAVVGGSLEKFALEIRGLQRTEVREVEEPFQPGQKGSSSMPHKRNPEKCERICGLSRLLRGYALAAFENQALWHERDISHSSVERVVLPDATIVLDYMIHLFTQVLRGLRVYPENMRRNLEATGGLVFSQRVLLALVERGMSREEAYAVVQRRAMEAWETGRPFRELVAADEAVRRRLTPQELAACFDPAPHLRHVDEIFARLGLADDDGEGSP
ncbi:MAG: adenylosuccinate lyase [Clostridia bacterium]|nr:adenylosuccinate lyase [Clostridia bacterium]